MVQTILSRREKLVMALQKVMAMHLEAREFDAHEGLPDSLDLGPAVMQRVRVVQTDAFSCVGDLQMLHKQGLSSYDLIRQLAWVPSPQVTVLSANFFHSMDPREISRLQ
jgi:hypothetical protein